MNTSFEPKSQTPTQRAPHQESQSAKVLPSRTIVHAKLEMTEPGDHDEREADAIANTVMSGGKIARKISSGGSGSSGIAVSSQMESQLNHLQGGGQAMPEGLRSMMESGFGQDFSQVRLHTDGEAADMSSSIHAKAFTHGNDIYFNRGQFSPDTTAGQCLVAHELTHVLQGSPLIRRQDDNLSGLDPVQIKQIQSPFLTEVGYFDEKSINLLNNTTEVFKEEISKFIPFACGEGVWKDSNENIINNQIYIPSISNLVKKCNMFLQKGDKSRLRSEGNGSTIKLDNPEVRNYLYNSISDNEAAYFYLWMKYCKNSTNALSKALGFPPLQESDYVKHYYTLRYLMSTPASGGFIVVASGELTKYVVSYTNNLGLQWSMIVDRISGGLGVGFSVGTPVALKACAIDDLCSSAPEESKEWLTPYDFAHSKASVGVDASVSAGFGAEVSAGASLVMIDMPGDKGELIFDMSAQVMITMGIQAGVSAKYGMNASFGLSNAAGFSNKETQPFLVFPPSNLKDERKSENYPLLGEVLYFETGSDEVYSKTDGDENSKRLNRVVQTIRDGYNVSKTAGNLEGIIIEITGHSSPLWTMGSRKDRESKNLALSQKRADAARKALDVLLRPTNIIANVVYRITRLFHDDKPINHYRNSPVHETVTAEGDKQGMDETGDITNNDEFYRKAEIFVYLQLSRSTYGITKP